jgi:cell wall-associated NlpC family hydrolase
MADRPGFDPATDSRLNPTRKGEGEAMQVATGHAGLRAAPNAQSEQINQALFGEAFIMFDRKDGWGYGQLARDRYVGWISLDRLAPQGVAPTHWLSVPRTLVFSNADLKSLPVSAISINALLAFEAESGPWRRIAGSGWIFAAHASKLGDWRNDYVDVALRYVGAPYLWGGRETAGVDCSGLVQCALQACGLSPLRDTDMQAATLGQSVDWSGDLNDLRRGDLVYWRGHVAIVLDGQRLLHANAWHMATEIEPLAPAFERIAQSVGAPVIVRRLT